MNEIREVKEVESSNNSFPFKEASASYPQFEMVTTGEYYPYNHIYEDFAWGCAWRAIQSILSAHGFELDFRALFLNFVKRSQLMVTIEKKLPHLLSEQLHASNWAPEQNVYNWAEPFIGQIICESLNIPTQLVLVNGYPKCYAPESVFEACLNFEQFWEVVKKTIPDSPVMIDDSEIALTIIGYREGQKNRKHLVLADPHIKSNLLHASTGIYEVVLDEQGKLVEYVVEDEGNLVYSTFKKIDFFEKKWMALATRPGPIKQ